MSASEREHVDVPALDAVRDGDGGLAIWDPDWHSEHAWIQSDLWAATEAMR